METTKETWCEAEVNRIVGEIAIKSPQPHRAKARAYFERALAISRKQQAKSWELRAAMSMARLWRDQGKRKKARDLSLRCTAGSLRASTRLSRDVHRGNRAATMSGPIKTHKICDLNPIPNRPI